MPRHEKKIFAYAKTKAQISNRTTDQRLCFRYIDGAIPLLSESELYSHNQVCVGPGRKPKDRFCHDVAQIWCRGAPGIETFLYYTSPVQLYPKALRAGRNRIKDGNKTLLIHLSHVMRKPTFCICENKDAYQLRGINREADQRLCFRYIDRTIPLLSKSEISSR